jgi:glycosyltransferase involved in cell wall biosynthesis
MVIYNYFIDVKIIDFEIIEYSMKNNISVVIITKNEIANIKPCLESVKWADEIIIIDSESTDKTVEIGKQYTQKIYVKKWEGYAAQKSYALSQANNEWVLSLDADERVTDKLADEILSLDLEKYDGYEIKRDNYFLGKLIKGCGWGRDYQLRLFRKSKTKLSVRTVHEKFIVDGNISRLKNTMLHYSYNNLREAFIKINNYSTLEAHEKSHRKTVNLITLITVPFLSFLQHFIIRKGFIDGLYGLIISLMHAITKLQVQMKIWELKRKQ